MTTHDQRVGATWDRAARSLAAHVNRRARIAVFARTIGTSLLVAAAIALAWRALGQAAPFSLDARVVVLLLLGAGLGVGVLVGLRAARRVRPVGSGDAAWALDRLAEAGGRGLTAAVAQGPAASEAAWAEPALPPPPAVRLLPPGGLVLGVAAVLLGALALLVADRRTDAATRVEGRGEGQPAIAGGAGGANGGDPITRARTSDREARALDRRADDARRVRAALNLPAEGPLDPREVAAKLANPERRLAAARAASSGTALSKILGDEGTTAEALARLLEQGEVDRAEAARSRRAATEARAQATSMPVPAGRRAVVNRYMQLNE